MVPDRSKSSQTGARPPADARARQLPLGVELRSGATFSNYVAAGNREAVQILARFSAGSPPLYLWGGSGVGKTHLLEAVCHSASERGGTPVFVPLRSARDLSPEVFEGLESLAVICLDDVEAIAGKREWEAALFHLFNRASARGTPLVITASGAPRHLPLGLADLRSRLAAALVLRLEEIDDDAKVLALCMRAQGQGFEMPEEVAHFLLRRHRRATKSLFALLDRLAYASLAHQRKLTVPFVREIIDSDAGAGPGP